jgi:hypothetical protein
MSDIEVHDSDMIPAEYRNHIAYGLFLHPSSDEWVACVQLRRGRMSESMAVSLTLTGDPPTGEATSQDERKLLAAGAMFQAISSLSTVDSDGSMLYAQARKALAQCIKALAPDGALNDEGLDFLEHFGRAEGVDQDPTPPVDDLVFDLIEALGGDGDGEE